MKDGILKRMIKSATRILPDSVYIRLAYFRVFKRFPNLKDPKTFNEKLQWLKLHNRKPIYTKMVDKIEAKKYVADIIGEQYIIPTLGVWDNFNEIDFDSLPEKFVLKCSHDSGGLIICKNKAELDLVSVKKMIENSLKTNYYWYGREWPYKNVKPRIIAEKYMEDENKAEGLTDYKFFCFNKKPKLLYVSQGLQDHSTARISFYDMKGAEMPFCRSDYLPLDEGVILPTNFAEMCSIADKLANKIDSPFVRIDLYSIQGKTYFSEITFSPAGGCLPFEPSKWDRITGDWIILPHKK